MPSPYIQDSVYNLSTTSTVTNATHDPATGKRRIGGNSVHQAGQHQGRHSGKNTLGNHQAGSQACKSSREPLRLDEGVWSGMLTFFFWPSKAPTGDSTGGARKATTVSRASSHDVVDFFPNAAYLYCCVYIFSIEIASPQWAFRTVLRGKI